MSFDYDGCMHHKGLLCHGTDGIVPLRTSELSNDFKAAVVFVRNYSHEFSNKRMLNFRKYKGAKCNVRISVWSHVQGSATNNNGFCFGLLDLLTSSLYKLS
jgi:hypothetical protein